MSAEYDLVMPFVTVTSKGGPHDDVAYVAGWEMGQLDYRLALAAFGGHNVPPTVLRRENLPQIQLIAMKHGLVDRIVEWDRDAGWCESHSANEWVLVEFVLDGESEAGTDDREPST